MTESTFQKSVTDLLNGSRNNADDLKRLLFSYDLQKDGEKRNFIKHDLLSLVNEVKKLDLGKYYTPKELVETVREFVKPYLKKDSVVLDTAAGTGAFLDCFPECEVMGGDVDEISVEIMKILGFGNCRSVNALKNVSRRNYNIDENANLIIVGNPPYNDTTSLYRRKIKTKNNFEEIDTDILSNDLGISFFRSYNKLNADIVCILHPLSYLIKKRNFLSLKEFRENYILRKGLIFSSEKFKDTRQTPFPVVIALYEKNPSGMDYNYILNFNFEMWDDKRKFILNNFETIDDENYIRKYPPQKNSDSNSDIGLYIHNFRDLNSLITRGNFSDNNDRRKFVPVFYKDLYKYAYLNSVRRYFGKDFKFGNLSPLVKKNDLENKELLRDIFIIDAIIHNQNIKAFCIDNKDSIVCAKKLYSSYKLKYEDSQNEVYKIFLDFTDGKKTDIPKLKKIITDYFERLKEESFEKDKS